MAVLGCRRILRYAAVKCLQLVHSGSKEVSRLFPNDRRDCNSWPGWGKTLLQQRSTDTINNELVIDASGHDFIFNSKLS